MGKTKAKTPGREDDGEDGCILKHTNLPRRWAKGGKTRAEKGVFVTCIMVNHEFSIVIRPTNKFCSHTTTLAH